MARKKILGGIGLLAGGVAITQYQRFRFNRTTARRVDDLLATSRDFPDQPFAKADITRLPDPVRRYLRDVIESGRPPVRDVRLEQQGAFRLGNDPTAPWKPLTAIQHFTVYPPGFVWEAHIELAPFLPVHVVDASVDGRGSLHAKLYSAITVAEANPTPELNDAELQRYLAECVWFPTALLPTAGVKWKPVDDRTARATLEHRGASATLVFHFDDRDRVARVSTDRRYRQEDEDYAPWTGYFSDYQMRNGLVVPTQARVKWNLPGGDLPYWRATISAIDHQPS